MEIDHKLYELEKLTLTNIATLSQSTALISQKVNSIEHKIEEISKKFDDYTSLEKFNPIAKIVWALFSFILGGGAWAVLSDKLPM